MLLVIFGAGASNDSWSDKPLTDRAGRIPLADDLFDPIYAPFVFAAMRPILPLLRTRPAGVSVEQRLQELQSEIPRSEQRARQLLAIRFYLDRMLTAVENAWIKESGYVSNYRTLLDELNFLVPSEAVSFVTFNYDTLLERAIESDTPRSFPEVNDYVKADERLSVYKLHGSLGWARGVDAAPMSLSSRPLAKAMIQNAPALRLTEQWTKRQDTLGRALTVPALAVPLESKQDFECPPGQIEHLRAVLPEVTRVLSIGWRATDQPFLDLLQAGARSVRRLDCVALTNPDAVMGRLAAVLPVNVATKTHAGGFTKYVINREIRNTLAIEA